jgi:hypothetical protein
LTFSGLPYTLLRPQPYMQNIARAAAAVAQSKIYQPFEDGKLEMIDGRDIDGVPTKPPTEEVHEDDAHTLPGSFRRLRRGAGPAVARDAPPEPRDYRDLLARASPAVGVEDRACLHADARPVTERGGGGALGVVRRCPKGRVADIEALKREATARA